MYIVISIKCMTEWVNKGGEINIFPEIWKHKYAVYDTFTISYNFTLCLEHISIGSLQLTSKIAMGKLIRKYIRIWFVFYNFVYIEICTNLQVCK